MSASKLEFRNPKFETNPKYQCSNAQNGIQAYPVLVIRILVINSCFGPPWRDMLGSHLYSFSATIPDLSTESVVAGSGPGISPAFAEAASRRQVLWISDFPILLEWNTDQCPELLTTCDVNGI
jgi:hypothetical protein